MNFRFYSQNSLHSLYPTVLLISCISGLLFVAFADAAVLIVCNEKFNLLVVYYERSSLPALPTFSV